MLFRPGPYVNAEANAGGFPLWLTTGAYGTLRNNDTRYTAAWEPYFSKLSEIVSEYLITKGGNVILYQVSSESFLSFLLYSDYRQDRKRARRAMVRIAIQKGA